MIGKFVLRLTANRISLKTFELIGLDRVANPGKIGSNHLLPPHGKTIHLFAAKPDGMSFKPASLHLTTPQMIVLIYLGIVASGVGFFLWNVGARRTNVGALAIFNNAKIPLGILASALIFQDKMLWRNLLVGGAIIAASLLLNHRLCRKPRM